MLTESDEEQLKLLSIFHYVLAGLTAFMGLLPLLYVLIGAFAVGASILHEAGEGAHAVMITGAMLVAFGLLLAIVIFAFAFVKFLVARFLVRHQNYTFCLIYAIVELLFVPLGTVLGIFTLIVLSRPHIKSAFIPKSVVP